VDEEKALCVTLPQTLNSVAPAIFQVHYFSDLPVGSSVINFTNSGAETTAAGGPGNICANVYTFSPDEQMISCCSCVVTPNGLLSLSVKDDLISNPLTGAVPNSAVVKFVATSGTTCNPSNITLAPVSNLSVGGLLAWGTTVHALPGTPTRYGLTETPFQVAIPSVGELNKLTSVCGFIQTSGSGSGICKSCRTGGL
jgi:hypothetical protein